MHWNAPLPVALESKGLLGPPENVIILVLHPKSYVSYTSIAARGGGGSFKKVKYSQRKFSSETSDIRTTSQ